MYFSDFNHSLYKVIKLTIDAADQELSSKV